MSQPQVFISYQRADSDFARQVREHLVAAGVHTWMDQYDIPVGAYWPDEIDKGLAASDVVLGILSPDSVASRNVKNEWDWALQNNKQLLLLQVKPSVIPHRYVSINFIDAVGHDPASAFATLLDTLGVVTVTSHEPASSMQPATRHSARRSAARRNPKPLMAGREREQTLLERQLDGLLIGRGSVVLIGGEAGIGKTTLTAWLTWAAEERGALVVSGGCFDLTTTPPYGPWVEITRNWPEDQGLPDVPAQLRGGEALNQVHSQAALFEIVAGFFEATTAVRPLVLLLEDLHWTDQATLDLLRFVARFTPNCPLMLVVTYREDELTRRHPLFQLLPSLARETNAQRMTLGRLEGTAIDTLITSSYPLPAGEMRRLSDYVGRLSEGNPFFAGEVLRALEESGALVQVDGMWRVTALDRVQVPALVRQVIEGRLARLSDDARRLLEAAAVIGHEVEIDLWLEVSGADENTLVDTLERAIEARLVDELPDRARLRFTHALVRETLYEGLISLRLRAWHRKVAEILAARPQPDPDTVAFHLQTAGDPRAYDWLVRAGDRARRSFALADAIERFERALGYIAVDPGHGQERGWLLYRVAVLMRIEDPKRALGYLSEAISLAEQSGDRALLAYGLFMKGLLTCFSGDGSSGIPQMRAGVDAIDALQPGDLDAAGPLYTTLYYDQLAGSADARLDQVRVNVGKGTLVLFLGVTARFADAIAIGVPFVESASRERLSMSALHSVADAYIGLLYAYAAQGDPARARAFGDLAIENHQTIGSYWLLVTLIESNLSEFVILAYEADQPDRWQQAISQLQRLDELVRGTLTSLEGYEKGADRLVALRDARWDVLRDHNERRAQMETQPVALYGMMALASAAYHLGDRAQAREAILQTGITPGHPSDTMGNSLWTIGVTEIACRLALDEGDVETARAWIEMIDSFNDEHGIVLWRARTELLRVRLHRATDDLPAAEAAARRALELASDPRQPLSLLAAHRALVEILTATGRLDAAEVQLDQAIALAEACQMALETALTQLAEAALRLRQGNHARAEQLLAEVRAFAEPRGGKLILEQVDVVEAQLP